MLDLVAVIFTDVPKYKNHWGGGRDGSGPIPHKTSEEPNIYMGRKQEDACLPNFMVLYRVISNPYCEFNFKKIFTKPSGNV